jgi:hypothetical protein
MKTVKEQWLEKGENDRFNAAGMMENNWGQPERPRRRERCERRTWHERPLRWRDKPGRTEEGRPCYRDTNAIMESRTKWLGLWVGALVAFAAQWSPGDVTQQDTTMPNRFEFTQAEYVVAEDATNAVITVRFYPGNRAVAGSVAYTTEDGTAIAGEDYVGVSGNLWFSGWEPRCLTVPVIWDDSEESDQTVRLRLLGSETTLVGPQATATLRITNVRPPPRLQIAASSDGLPTVSWPDDGEAWILEKCSNPLAGDWTPVTDVAANASGRLYVTDTRFSPVVFYRLRKP